MSEQLTVAAGSKENGNGIFDTYMKDHNGTNSSMSIGTTKEEQEEEQEEEVVVKVHLTAKWNGATFKLTMPETCTVGQLKVCSFLKGCSVLC
jgi:hypothetical protein